MIINILLLGIAFIVIWLSTRLAIETIQKFTNHAHLSRVTLSLFVLGTITAFPEIAIMANSLWLKAPQIALGNLIGSQIFLLFVVVPVLAIVSRGVQLQLQFKNVSLALTLLVAVVPMVALLDQGLSMSEVLIILGTYGVFFVTLIRRSSFLERIAERLEHEGKNITLLDGVKLLFALGVLMLASNTAVREIIEIAAWLQTPRFLLSLLLLPIGTNLPELSLALNHARNEKDIALGDYLGSITFNSLLIAILTLALGGVILIGQSITAVIALFGAGLVVFWWCCYSREFLNVKEGLLLLLAYVLIVSAALWQILGLQFFS